MHITRAITLMCVAVKNTLISQKDAVDTRTYRVKPNTPKLLAMPGKNGGQLWDLLSISMLVTEFNKSCGVDPCLLELHGNKYQPQIEVYFLQYDLLCFGCCFWN